MRATTILKAAFAFIVIYSLTIISCSKTTNPTTVIKDSTVVKDSTVLVIKDSTYYSDSIVAASLKQGVLVYLNFNGAFADSSGNGNAVTAAGGATLGYDEHGNANRAFVGSGTGQEVIVTNNGSIAFDTAFTISMDFMTNGSAYRQCYASFVSNSTGYGPTFLVGTILSGYSNIVWDVADSNLLCDSWGAGYTTNDSASFAPVAGSWYNLIASYHKGVMKVYLNGSLISTKTSTSTTVNICPASQLLIGAWWSADPITINGKVDEFRLYNRTLNANEIAYLAKGFQPAE